MSAEVLASLFWEGEDRLSRSKGNLKEYLDHRQAAFLAHQVGMDHRQVALQAQQEELLCQQVDISLLSQPLPNFFSATDSRAQWPGPLSC